MVRSPLSTSLVSALAFIVVSASTFAREPAEIVYDRVHPAVVSLQNAEGSGTGIVLDRKGLILTNAHVIMSPLPFQASVDIRFAGKIKKVTYKKVAVLGIHPKYDLALVRIDPKEHGGALLPADLSKEKVRPGRTVYAIGNPGGGNEGITLTKTITSGMLSGLRVIESLQYLQVSAPINPGNSGGPLCDAKGNVIGVVTFKFTDVEGIGFAIPTAAFKLNEFVPWQKRKADPAATRELVKIGERYLAEARQIHRVNSNDKRLYILRSIALRAYWKALTFSPGDAALFYNVGMIYRTLDAEEIALPYLVRSVELSPWGAGRGDEFREIGYSLVKLKRIDEGLIAYKEGIAKYPTKAGKIYEDMAITYILQKDFVEAGYAAKSAIQAGDCRVNVMNDIFRQAFRAMTPAQSAMLDKKMSGMFETWKKSDAAAQRAQESKQKFMTPAFTALVKKLGTLDQLDKVANQLTQIDAQIDNSKPDKPTSPGPSTTTNPVPAPKPVDVEAKWIDQQLDRARLYQSAKNSGKVRSILQGIVDRYPDHPQSKKASAWLKRLK